MTARKRIKLPTTYAALFEAGEWRDIPGCPGRKVLPGTHEISPQDLVGADVPVRRFEVEGAADPVHVAVVVGGGLISYAKPDGTWVHTLNTEAGLSRKLADLGIELP